MHSLSFDSRDALYTTDDGSYFFSTSASSPSIAGPIKVSLDTLELTPTQLPIEKSWSRVYFSEGFRTSETCRRVRVVEQYDGGAYRTSFEALLPVYLNKINTLEILSASSEDGLNIKVTTETPHCMWGDSVSHSRGSDEVGECCTLSSNLAQEWSWGDPIRIIETSVGEIAFHSKLMQYVDEFSFVIHQGRCSACHASTLIDKVGWNIPDTGCLYTPTIPGPLQLSSILQRALRSSSTTQSYTVSVDAASGGLVLSVKSPILPVQCAGTRGDVFGGSPDSCSKEWHIRIEIDGDELAGVAGLSGAIAKWVVRGTRHSAAQWEAGKVHETSDTEWSFLSSIKRAPSLSIHSRGPVIDDSSFQVGRSSAYRGGVGVADLPIGWYDLSEGRPRGAAEESHSLSRSWSIATNPMYFSPSPAVYEEELVSPLLLKNEEDTTLISEWGICFTDSSGGDHTVVIPNGSFDTRTMCAFLSDVMTEAASPFASAISVRFTSERGDISRGRFTFTLTPSDTSDEIVPTPCMFALDFASPQSTVEAERFGFSKAFYSGSNSYTSTTPVSIPALQGNSHPARGVWGVDVIKEKRQLRFTCTHRPDMVVVLKKVISNRKITLWVRTSDGRPVAHGFRVGDVVQLRQTRDTNIMRRYLRRKENDFRYEWKEYTEGCKDVSMEEKTSNITLTVTSTPDFEDPLDLYTLITVNSPQYVVDSSGSPCELSSQLLKGVWYLCAPRDVYPSMFFDKETCPDTIHPELLGLPALVPSAAGADGFDETKWKGMRQTAFVWGSVGDVSRRGRDEYIGGSSINYNTWPLSAWGTYRLDPPNICLVYFNEGRNRGSTLLHHTSGVNVTTPIARIDLRSLCRKGRVQTEVFANSDEFPNVFQLRFANMDGTRYHTHNTIFSFTLKISTVTR